MNTELLVALIPALGIVLLIVGVYKVTLENRDKAQERIQDLVSTKKTSAARQSAGVLGQKKQTDKILKRRKKKKDGDSFVDRLDVQLERANLPLSPNEFMLIGVISGVLGFLAALFLFGLHPAMCVLVGIASIFLPTLYMKVRTMLRVKKAKIQFPDVIDAMVNGFKTGYGFSKCVQMIADNFDDPWGTEYGKMSAELNLGVTLEDALNSFSKRMPSPDVDLFVTAILIQKETGGNMSELLGNLSKTCRDRLKLFQKVGALSAQGKLSAGIICCVPFVLFGMMFLFLNRPTLILVTHPIGIVLLIITAFWMSCGIFVLFKIAQIEV